MRCATLVLVLYLALDFATPLMPGSVSFDPDESVHATRAGGIRDHQELVVAPSIDWAARTSAVAPASPRCASRRRIAWRGGRRPLACYSFACPSPLPLRPPTITSR